MSTILLFLMIGVAFVIYLTKPHFLFLYWLLSIPIFAPFVALLGGVTDPDSTSELLWRISGFYTYLYMLILINEVVFRKRKLKGMNSIWASIIVLAIYFVFLRLATCFSSQALYLDIKSLLCTVLPMIIMSINSQTRPKENQLFYIVVFLFVIELLCVCLNVKGIYVYVASYYNLLYDYDQEGLFSGSFYRANGLGDYFCVIYLFIAIDYFTRKRMSMLQFILFTIASFVLLVCAGSRATMALFFIVLIFCIFIFCKKQRMTVLLSILAVGLLLIFLSRVDTSYIDTDSGSGRIISGLASFTQSKKNKEENTTTTRLSEKLVDEYFYKSPILGNGRSPLGENAYSIADKVDSLSNMKSDARLAYMLVEFGLLGCILYFMYYLSIFKFFRKQYPHPKGKNVYIIIFVFFMLFTYTEPGFFDGDLFPMVYVYLFSVYGANNLV